MAPYFHLPDKPIRALLYACASCAPRTHFTAHPPRRAVRVLKHPRRAARSRGYRYGRAEAQDRARWRRPVGNCRPGSVRAPPLHRRAALGRRLCRLLILQGAPLASAPTPRPPIRSLTQLYGPHTAALYTRRAALPALHSVVHHFHSPRFDAAPFKLQPGGPGYELTYAAAAVLPYLVSLSSPPLAASASPEHLTADAAPALRTALARTSALFVVHERALLEPLLAFLTGGQAYVRGVRVVGPQGCDARAPTVSFVVVGERSMTSRAVVGRVEELARVRGRYSCRVVRSVRAVCTDRDQVGTLLCVLARGGLADREGRRRRRREDKPGALQYCRRGGKDCCCVGGGVGVVRRAIRHGILWSEFQRVCVRLLRHARFFREPAKRELQSYLKLNSNFHCFHRLLE